MKALVRGLIFTLLCGMPLIGWPEEHGSAGEAVELSLALPGLPPKAEFEGILERPLFSESRTPQQEASTEQTATSARTLQEQWRLTAVILTDEQMSALFRQRNGTLHRQLQIGMPLDDFWVLHEINDTSVTLTAGDNEVRLQLREPRDTASLISDSPQSTNPGIDTDSATAAPAPSDPKEVPNE